MYYIIINGAQAGPYPKEELTAHGLTADSMVWRAGMSDWMPASEVAELKEVLYPRRRNFDFKKTEEAEQPYQQAQQPYGHDNRTQVYGQPAYQQQNQAYHAPTNWMSWAILATVLGLCSCIGFILGIIAITNASKANNAYIAGNRTLGDSANSTARTLTIVALCFDGLGIIINIIVAATM